MADRPHVLIVDDEPNVRRVLATLLEQADIVTTRAESGEQALELVRAQDPDLVLTDLAMPGVGGLELLALLRPAFPEIPVVVLTAHGTVDNAVEAMRRGAHDFLTKPFDREQVVAVVRKALGQAQRGRSELKGPVAGARCGIVGESAALEKLRVLIEKVAPTPATVLIHGETGTGKELVADALHNLSPRAARPLIKINCGAIPENLVESELFGHERGAFTGADRERPGRFELADGGTLFLDEIGELPLASQVKLLRVLQDRKIERVGGVQQRLVDVRVVAATHRDLDREVSEGRFREDLYYRLKVIVIDVPPLRDRREDICGLVDCFLDKHAARLARPRPSIDASAVAELTERAWPGNVRELENAVERAILLADGPQLTRADFGQDTPDPARSLDENPTTLKAAVRGTERRSIRAALAATDGNVTHAAARLGLSRRGLQLKMKDLGLRDAPAD